MSNKLADEFNIEDVKVEIKTFKEILNEIKEIPDPTKIVTAAIEKASIFLDLIHSEIENGEMTARYMEVASQLINTIILSSNFLSSNEQSMFDNRIKALGSKQKDRELDIKEKDLEIKRLMYKGKGDNKGQQNIIVTDHKSIMKFLSETKSIPVIPTEKEI